MTMTPPDFARGQRPRALGYKPDLFDERDLPAGHVLGAAVRQELVVPASMMKYRSSAILQGGASSCVAHALCRSIDMCLRYELEKADKAHVEPPPPSRGFIYFNARRQEAVEANKRGEPPPPMIDGGSFPRLAMRAVQRLGYCPERVYPYSDDTKTINDAPPASAYHAAFDQTGFRYYRVLSSGRARVAEVAHALALGRPVFFGLTVDSAFMGWDGDTPINAVDVHDPEAGGHMLCVLEVTADRVVADNWWGEDWGAKGLAHLSHHLFGSDVITDVYVIETAPTFSSAKEEAA